MLAPIARPLPGRGGIRFIAAFNNAAGAHAPRAHGISILGFLDMPRSFHLVLAVVALSASLSGESRAQAWAYPAFQPPRITDREFNVGVADTRHVGTSAVFQWREQVGPRQDLSLDVGIADPDARNSDAVLFIGGQFAYEITRSTSLVPLDLLFTFGGNIAAGGGVVSRIPIGLVVGHRFPTEGEGAVTPFVHPRLVVDLCSRCTDKGDLSVVFDVGANVELSDVVSIRGAATFSGSSAFDGDGFGLSLAWSPPRLSELRNFLRPRR